jgi:hypothetical protein
MLPNCTITISKDGSSKIVGKEETSDCHKLSSLGRAAGKVTKDDKEDHVPAFQTVQNKGK